VLLKPLLLAVYFLHTGELANQVTPAVVARLSVGSTVLEPTITPPSRVLAAILLESLVLGVTPGFTTEIQTQGWIDIRVTLAWVLEMCHPGKRLG
jgi:hypothetical protein